MHIIGRCVENIGDEPATVLEKYCDSQEKPESELECHEPCPGHCVVGEWSPWSKCQEVSSLLHIAVYIR